MANLDLLALYNTFFSPEAKQKRIQLAQSQEAQQYYHSPEFQKLSGGTPIGALPARGELLQQGQTEATTGHIKEQTAGEAQNRTQEAATFNKLGGITPAGMNAQSAKTASGAQAAEHLGTIFGTYFNDPKTRPAFLATLKAAGVDTAPYEAQFNQEAADKKAKMDKIMALAQDQKKKKSGAASGGKTGLDLGSALRSLVPSTSPDFSGKPGVAHPLEALFGQAPIVSGPGRMPGGPAQAAPTNLPGLGMNIPQDQNAFLEQLKQGINARPDALEVLKQIIAGQAPQTIQ